MMFLWLCFIYRPFYFILVYLLSLGLRPIIQFGPKVGLIFEPFCRPQVAHVVPQIKAQILAPSPA